MNKLKVTSEQTKIANSLYRGSDLETVLYIKSLFKQDKRVIELSELYEKETLNGSDDGEGNNTFWELVDYVVLELD